MRAEQWEVIVKCAGCERMDHIPVGLIIDSPWLPGFYNVSTLDYFTDINIWFEINLKVVKDFPEIIFIPGFWVEYGMGAEPSSFGCVLSFSENQPPSINPIASKCKDIISIREPDPTKDGLMPFILNIYKKIEKRVNDEGYKIKIVAARGPLALTAHLVGVTNFLSDIKLDANSVHQVLKITTKTVKKWLEAQAEVLQEVEGILVLDDIAGFLSNNDYLEFAHPYLKEIFDGFKNCIKLFHNDTPNPASYKYCEELGINIFNFSHQIDIQKTKKLVGDRVCLMGNVPPLDVLVNGSPEDVKQEVAGCLESFPDNKGLILSAGGGASPGTKRENIIAMVETARDYNLFER